jgi:ATP-dependent Clp protease ATP-binding subunit ClpA
MYARFTDRARKVMQLANQEAMRFNHEYIGTEHMLLGLIKEGSGVAANVLKNLDIDLRKARHQIEHMMQSGPEIIPMGQMPPTPKAMKVCEYAIEEARQLGHHYVGTEHLLLGLLRDQECGAAHVLMYLGLKLTHVREEVMILLGIDQGSLQQPRDFVGIPTKDPAEEFHDLPELAVKAIKELDAEIKRLQIEKESMVAVSDFEKAASLRDQQDKLRKKREQLIREWREES